MFGQTRLARRKRSPYFAVAMSKRLALSFLAFSVVALVACGGNSASRYCSNKADCDGTSADECTTTSGYEDLSATCQRDGDIYYDCLAEYSTCSGKVFTPAARCESLQALVVSCKQKDPAAAK